MITIGDNERELLRVTEALNRSLALNGSDLRVGVDYEPANENRVWSYLKVNGVGVLLSIGGCHEDAARNMIQGLRYGRESMTPVPGGRGSAWMRVPPFSSVEELELKLACSGPVAGITPSGKAGA